MTFTEAQVVCRDIDYEFKHYDGHHVQWKHIYPTEEALQNALKNVYVPKNGLPPKYTFYGYEYIYSFARALQAGKTLSPAQARQAKRLALEIHKAYSINEYVKEKDSEVRA